MFHQDRRTSQRCGQLDALERISDYRVTHPMALRKMRSQLLLLLGTLLIAVTTVAGERPPALLDQHGDSVELSRDSVVVQVAIIVSAKRIRRIKPWEVALREEFPDLELIRIADIPQSGSAEYERVAATFRKRLPPELDVGIDLNGEWAQRFDLDTRVPNIIIFDAEKNVVATHSGMYKQKRFTPLRDELRALTADAEG